MSGFKENSRKFKFWGFSKYLQSIYFIPTSFTEAGKFTLLYWVRLLGVQAPSMESKGKKIFKAWDGGDAGDQTVITIQTLLTVVKYNPEEIQVYMYVNNKYWTIPCKSGFLARQGLSNKAQRNWIQPNKLKITLIISWKNCLVQKNTKTKTS